MNAEHFKRNIGTLIRIDNNHCWIWQYFKNKRGYGILRYNDKMVGAHRVSYELFAGPIPTKMHVLHKCDNPPCINPEHLFLGTQKDNNQDRHRKGRDKKGYYSRKLKTHCKYGHLRTRENVYSNDGCKECKRVQRGVISVDVMVR